jgi:peptidoglycan-associated lipoprotein
MPRGLSRVFAVLVAAGLVTALTACGKKPPVTAVPPPPPPPVVNVPPPAPPPPESKPAVPPAQPPAAPKAPTEEEIFARMTIEELNAKGYLEDVLFEYDRAELTEGARTTLQKNADWLRKWTSTRITVEGHADERGTNEYNLALGEQRAAAVRDFLAGLGVPATRMNIVSKGEEMPVCREETEGCWSRNRRGHFVITAKN